ncbi:MAG: DNA polymerase III subunit delta [Planctomycetota bacterium]|nr:MAG: DNA polymerase III subunit delta [Planctomycetota bacterium]
MAASKPEFKKKHKPIYVIVGKEDTLVNAECDKLLDQLLKPQQRTIGLFNVHPAEVSAAEVLDELRTLPFLTETRVVLVKNADDFVSKNRQLFEKYFDNPSLTGILILTVSSWPSNTKLAKRLPKVGKLIRSAQPKRWQLPHYLIQYANDAHDKKLTVDAAELLIELIGDNLPQLYSEIDKLALFAHTEKAITLQHIESLIGHNRLFSAFAVIDAITVGNLAEAVSRLRKMFAEDRTADYTVVGAFAFHFRRLFEAKVLLEDDFAPSEIANRLRIWSNRDSFFKQLQRMSLEQIGAILQQLAKIDYAIKTGQTKAEIAAEQFILRLAIA